MGLVMKEVKIDGDIGYSWCGDSVTAKSVEAQLEGIAEGEEIQVSINSAGGSVYEGILIFNLIRDYAKSHPVAARISGIAMSAASYIALAARTVDKSAKITASDNSVFMIHHPWTITLGNFEELKKDADYLEKLSGVFSSVYAFVSGQKESDVRDAMSAETFFVGQEIFDAGFSNDFEEITPDENEGDPGAFMLSRESRIMNAKLAFDETVKKAREAKTNNASAYHNDLEKAAAALASLPDFTKRTFGAQSRKINKEPEDGNGGDMKPEELLAQDKACYEAVFALGEKAALEKERQRVAAHIKRGEKTGAMDIAVKHIGSGKSVTDDDVNEEYFNAALDKRRLDARLADNPPPFTAGDEGEDDAALEAAFAAGTRGKDFAPKGGK
jgi:ATP-dependent protease ClpP protease subunit